MSTESKLTPVLDRPARPRLGPGRLEWPVTLGALVLALALAISVLAVDPRIVAAGVGILSLLLVSFRYPFAGLLFYLVVVYVRPEELRIAPVFLHLERVTGLTVLGAVLLRHMVRREEGLWPRHRLNAILLALLGVLCLSSLTAYWRGGAAAATMELVKSLVPYFLIICLADTPRRLRALTGVFTLTIVWHGLSSTLGYRSGTTVSLGENYLARAGGLTETLGDPNTMANLLVSGLPFACVAVTTGTNLWSRGLGVAAIGAALPAIALTGSRTGMISLGAVALLLVARGRRRLVVLGAVLVAMLLLWRFMPREMQQRYATILRPAGEVTYTGRLHGIGIAMHMWLSHPLLGVGPGCFGAVRHAEYEPSWMNPHNLFAQVASELGILGLIVFAGFIVATFCALERARKGLRVHSDSPELARAHWLAVAAEICLLALLVQGLASHNMYRFTYYFMAALAVRLEVLAASLPASRGPRGCGGAGPQSTVTRKLTLPRPPAATVPIFHVRRPPLKTPPPVALPGT